MSNVNFAPYQPPPDERIQVQASSAASASASASSRTPTVAPSVPRTGIPPPQEASAVSRASIDSDMDPRYATESYQSSNVDSPYSIPNAGATHKQSFQSAPAWAQHQQPLDQGSRRAAPHRGRPDHLSYSTAHGWNLSNLCFAAWSLPPFSSVVLLILETENDLVRFHAYQSGLMGIASVLIFWILRSWFGWKTLSIIVGMAFLGYYWVCGSNAATSAPTLARSPYLAYLGPLAEQWVGEE